jgi:hypothetical protein
MYPSILVCLFGKGKKDMERLLRTAEHVVDKGAVDVGATHADRIEERFVVGDEVFVVGQLFNHDDLLMAAVAEHHQTAAD